MEELAARRRQMSEGPPQRSAHSCVKRVSELPV